MRSKFLLCFAVAAAVLVSTNPSHAQEGYVAVSGIATFTYGDPANLFILEDRYFVIGTYMPYAQYDEVTNSFKPYYFTIGIEGLWNSPGPLISEFLHVSAPPRVSLGGLLEFDIPANTILFIEGQKQTFTGTNVDFSDFVDVSTTEFPITMTKVSNVQFVLDFSPDAPIPEPATWAMLITGFGLVGFAARRRPLTAT